MAKFNREDLTGEYTWTEVMPDDPSVSGNLDNTAFNASEGHEVLYLINTLMSEWDLMNIKSALKMERMLDDLPSDIHRQEEVKKWIKEKWTKYKSKKAKGKASRPAARQLPENAPENKISSRDHHHYCTNCNTVTHCEVIQLPHGEPSDTHLLQALSGIHYFKRLRKCTQCHGEFETVEIDSSLLYELMRTKSLVEKLKRELGTSGDGLGRA